MIPGSNLLSQALTIISGQTIGFIRCTGRVKSAAGQWVATYAAAVPKRGSFQPVPRQYYSQMGLDFNKEYCNWYDPVGAFVKDLRRDESPDQITFNGKTYLALSSNDWVAIDGWQGTLFVRIS